MSYENEKKELWDWYTNKQKEILQIVPPSTGRDGELSLELQRCAREFWQQFKQLKEKYHIN